MSNTTPGIGGGNSIGYKELFLDKSENGMSLNDNISQSFKDLQRDLAAVQDPANAGDPAKLMQLQVSMNKLQQLMSSTTQLINGLKNMADGINRNI